MADSYGAFVANGPCTLDTIVVEFNGRSLLRAGISDKLWVSAGDTVTMGNLGEVVDRVYELIDRGAFKA